MRPTLPSHCTAYAVAVVLLVLGSIAPGCRSNPREVGEIRVVPAQPVVRTTSAERFGLAANPGTNPEASPAAPSDYTWKLPPGWRALPPTPMRAGSFAVASSPEIDGSLTVLPSGGGGIDANLNRWRGQMSLPALTPQELQALPMLPVLGKQAALLECSGTYKGMGQETPREGAKLMGVALEHEGRAVFVKLVGPAAAVEQERDHFLALCQSLQPASRVAATPDDPNTEAKPVPSTTSDSPPLAWDDPPGWTRVNPGPMRLVSFVLGQDGATECYVVQLPGLAGGLAANINRWRNQMAQPELSAQEIAALPMVPMLGTEGRLVRIEGEFTGMDGASKPGAMLLGAICELPNQAVFVKMVGPRSVVEAETARFGAFCRSLRR